MFFWNFPSEYLLVIFPILRIWASRPERIASKTDISALYFVVVYIPFIFCPIYKFCSVNILEPSSAGLVENSSFSPKPEILIVDICNNLFLALIHKSIIFLVPVTLMFSNSSFKPKCFTIAPAFITVLIFDSIIEKSSWDSPMFFWVIFYLKNSL